MDGIEKILPTLPSWISIPIIVASIVLTLGPKIFDVFVQLGSETRALKREKDRLELLKLQYEIEAFRKEKNIDAISDPLFIVRSQRSTPNHGLESGPVRKSLPWWKRFLYGAAGASIPVLVRIAFLLPHMARSGGGMNAGYFLAVAFMAVLGGSGTFLIPKRMTSAFVCFLVGLSITLLFTAVVQETDRYEEIPVAPRSEQHAALRMIDMFRC